MRDGGTNLTFRLDDGDSEPAQTPSARKDLYFQAPIWQSPKLEDKVHSLTMNLTNFADGTFAATFVDFITYTASSSTPRDGLRLLVDDCDERIQWSSLSDWSVCGARDDVMMGTSSRSDVVGSSFTFNFTGEYHGLGNSFHSLTIVWQAQACPPTVF